ncbi:hypothetical protein SAMN05661099_1492 [Daejeonella lutea]|uniref:Uncharacterized protein n=1 Tax=Daejeonella lutea TaxID=572036 RepID=A0A1T5BCG8_9SPHI|nr:hypothetical protein SAMN05661099_1492 [Daejeonella lutea]
MGNQGILESLIEMAIKLRALRDFIKRRDMYDHFRTIAALLK